MILPHPSLSYLKGRKRLQEARKENTIFLQTGSPVPQTPIEYFHPAGIIILKGPSFDLSA